MDFKLQQHLELFFLPKLNNTWRHGRHVAWSEWQILVSALIYYSVGCFIAKEFKSIHHILSDNFPLKSDIDRVLFTPEIDGTASPVSIRGYGFTVSISSPWLSPPPLWVFAPRGLLPLVVSIFFSGLSLRFLWGITVGRLWGAEWGISRVQRSSPLPASQDCQEITYRYTGNEIIITINCDT